MMKTTMEKDEKDIFEKLRKIAVSENTKYEERARLCEAFRQGTLWHDNYVKKNKHEPAKEEIEEVSKDYSSYEYGNEGENYLTAGEFGQIENAFRKGAHWAAEHNKDSKL